MRAIYQQDNLFLYAGVVTKDVRIVTKNDVTFAVVALKDRNEDTIDIFFKNSEDKRLADRIKKAKVQTGSYISVLTVGEKDAKTATGLDFKYSGIWKFKGQDGKKNSTVIHGMACSGREVDKNTFSVSVPIKYVENGEESTRWYEITFYNSDDGEYRNADIAKKLLSEKTTCCIRGGEVKEKTVKGKDGKMKTYYNIIGFGIDMKPYDD